MKVICLTVFQCYSAKTCKKSYLSKIFAYFHLPPPWHVHLFAILVTGHAKLTRKIVGSYSRVFTVLFAFLDTNLSERSYQ